MKDLITKFLPKNTPRTPVLAIYGMGVKEENHDHTEDHAEGVNPDQAHSIADSSRPTRDIPIHDSISSYFSLHQHMFSKFSPQFTINRNHLAVNAWSSLTPAVASTSCCSHLLSWFQGSHVFCFFYGQPHVIDIGTCSSVCLFLLCNCLTLRTTESTVYTLVNSLSINRTISLHLDLTKQRIPQELHGIRAYKSQRLSLITWHHPVPPIPTP